MKLEDAIVRVQGLSEPGAGLTEVSRGALKMVLQSFLKARITAQDDNKIAGDRMVEKLRYLRSLGWAVAVHNDYKMKGTAMTFWLFTHASGRFIKGEGATDDVALDECLKQLSPSGVP